MQRTFYSLFSLAFLLLIGAFSFNGLNSCTSNKSTKIVEMNYDDYTDMWKVYKAFEKDGKFQDALAQLEKIESKSVEDKNDEQLLKSLFHRLAVTRDIHEFPILKQISYVESKIENLNEVGKVIAESYLAELYHNYFMQNSYAIGNLTNISSDYPEELTQWTNIHFISRINELYKSSLSVKTDNIPLANYNAIIEHLDSKKGVHLRSTIFDLLAHRAVDFFSNPRATITEPIYAFSFDQEEAFLGSEIFRNSIFETKDTSSTTLFALETFQQLEKVNAKAESDVLVDIILKRLAFSNQKNTNELKNEWYKASLVKLYERYNSEESGFLVATKLIELYINNGNNYSRILENDNNDLVLAMNLLDEIKSKYTSKDQQQAVKHYKSLLERREFNFSTEQVIPIGENVLIQIEYKNLGKLDYELYKLSLDDLKEYYKNIYEDTKILNRSRLHSTGTIELPDVKDYKLTTAELGIKGPEMGNYILFFKTQDDLLKSRHLFHVSNISYTTDRLGLVQVFNRISGEMMPANIDAYRYEWSGRNRKFTRIFQDKTDERGLYKIKDKTRNLMLDIHVGEDHLFFNNYISNNNVVSNQKRESIHSFTDRSIYRPGQKVYYKAIADEQTNGNDPQLLTYKEIYVKFLDANYQVIEETIHKTNEFGSINGSFTIPTDLLNGNFTIQYSFDKNRMLNQSNIKVEEYKRPKFAIEMSPLEGVYKLEESVQIEGKVSTFSGSAISDSEVNYYITRTPVYRYYYRGYYNREASKVIKRGVSKTDKAGKFTIDFIAEADKSFKYKNPVFNYTVVTEVTDGSGETRSNTSQVKAGAKAFVFDFLYGQTFTPFNNKTFKFNIKNQNNVPAKAKATIEIFKIADKEKNYRERYWKNTKHRLLNEAQFEKDFPRYQYNIEESDEAKGESIKKETIEINGSVEYDISNLDPGEYNIELSNSESVSRTAYVIILDKSAVPKNGNLVVIQRKDEYLPGESIKIDVYTSHNDIDVQVDILRHGKREERKFLKVSKYKEISIPVSKSDRGGIQVVVSAIKDSRFFHENMNFKVPYKDKELKLKWLTFRSDLYPGSEEKWKLKLTNYKDRNVSAELLTSMYDASLDEFNPHKWQSLILNRLQGSISIEKKGFRRTSSRTTGNDGYVDKPYFGVQYPLLNTLTNSYGAYGRGYRNEMRMATMSAPEADMVESEAMPQKKMRKKEKAATTSGVSSYKDDTNNMDLAATTPPTSDTNKGPALRTNLKETVFFFPDLKTNAEGETIIEFTMNEALTEWKLQTLAHSKNVDFVLDEQKIATSKDLMVFPNGPRFFRQGDKTSILTKVQNNTADKLWAKAYIKLINPFTNEDITDQLIKKNITKEISIDPKGSDKVSWEFNVPSNIEAITYQVYAESGEHTDGEENTAIVLSNRKLITESLVLSLPENSTTKVNIPTLEKLDKSSTMEAQLMDISVTSNPSWLAVQSLPYLIEYQYKCSEQIFSRYFGNALARHILDKNPLVEEVYSTWRENGNLKSPLSKNQELKSAAIEQTPWLLDALSEEEQMERMSVLFDQKRIIAELASDLKTLQERQNQGGFPWFPGGRPNWFITQHILEGIGQLHTMNVVDKNDPALRTLTQSAMRFVQKEFIYYDNKSKDPLYLSPLVIHFMYVQSFYPEFKDKKVEKRLEKYVALAREKWLDYSIMNQGHLALYFNRTDDITYAKKIIESLRQRTIYKENLGRYWKEVNGYNWNQSNIEKQALLIAAFDEIDSNNEEIDELKQWLLSNKQTNSWKSTKATTHAIFALIERGEKWIDNTEIVRIKVNNVLQAIPENKLIEATGQYAIKYRNDEVTSDKQAVEFVNENKHISWASTSVQYWEDLDKIENYQETPLQLKRSYFKKIYTDEGVKLVPLAKNEVLTTGDILTVRLSLIVDRPMEFIHLQDMRAAGTEPVDVLSGYRGNGGLYYYMETKDVATNFFVDYLRTGEYTLEYDQRIVQPGMYSAGVSTVQSMYAPEFGAHSEGMSLVIESD